LDIGFYAVPKKEEFDAYMLSVDNEQLRQHYDTTLYGEISDGYEISVDKSCSLNIFRDKIIWGIDAKINKKFPNNMGVFGH